MLSLNRYPASSSFLIEQDRRLLNLRYDRILDCHLLTILFGKLYQLHCTQFFV